MKSVAECIEIETSSTITRREEGKEVSFIHQRLEIVCGIVPIENCVFQKKIGGKRCDYLFLFDKAKQQYNYLKNGQSIAYYVELKGTSLAEASEQLLNSIKETKDQIGGFEINALVVSSRNFIPKFDNTEHYRNVKRLIRKNIQFEITPYTINL